MLPDLDLLRTHILPRLGPPELQAVGQTCRSLRWIVQAAEEQLAQRCIPPQHPLRQRRDLSEAQALREYCSHNAALLTSPDVRYC